MVDALFVWSVFRQIEVCRTLLGYPPQSLRDSPPSRVEPNVACPLEGKVSP